MGANLSTAALDCVDDAERDSDAGGKGGTGGSNKDGVTALDLPCLAVFVDEDLPPTKPASRETEEEEAESERAEEGGGGGNTTLANEEPEAAREHSAGCKVASCFFKMLVREKALEQKRQTYGFLPE